MTFGALLWRRRRRRSISGRFFSLQNSCNDAVLNRPPLFFTEDKEKNRFRADYKPKCGGLFPIQSVLRRLITQSRARETLIAPPHRVARWLWQQGAIYRFHKSWKKEEKKYSADPSDNVGRRNIWKLHRHRDWMKYPRPLSLLGSATWIMAQWEPNHATFSRKKRGDCWSLLAPP